MIKIHVKKDTQEFQAGEGSLAIVFTWMAFTKSLDFLQTAVGYLVCYDKDQPNKKQVVCAACRNVNWQDDFGKLFGSIYSN